MADPLCSELRILSQRCLSDLQVRYHEKGTYICIEGPRFSTRAESKIFRDVLHADIIGMTLVPECILARESEMCYLSISTVTDYDVWADEPVSSKEVLETLQKNVETTKNFLSRIIPLVPEERINCNCGTALKDALL
jgi:5'-methylthioadenosine phosphorylase